MVHTIIVGAMLALITFFFAVRKVFSESIVLEKLLRRLGQQSGLPTACVSQNGGAISAAL